MNAQKPIKQATDQPIRSVRATDLFGERRELRIEFRGEQYTLRVTRNDKLILTK